MAYGVGGIWSTGYSGGGTGSSAVAVVPSIIQIGTAQTPTSTVNSLTFPLSATPVLGRSIIVAFSIFSSPAGVASIADNKSATNVYALKASQVVGIYANFVYECPALLVTGSGFSITVNFSALAFASGNACEVSGLNTSGTVDRTGSNTATSTAESVTAGAPNTQATGVVVALVTTESDQVTGQSTPASTGYTNLWTQQNGQNSVVSQGSIKVVSAIETSTAAWTQSLSFTYYALLASLKGL